MGSQAGQTSQFDELERATPEIALPAQNTLSKDRDSACRMLLMKGLKNMRSKMPDVYQGAPVICASPVSAAAEGFCGQALSTVRYCSCSGSGFLQSIVNRFRCKRGTRELSDGQTWQTVREDCTVTS